MPFSDGGEGALNILEDHASGIIVNCEAQDAVGNPLKAPYFLFENGNSAWIELSKTSPMPSGLINRLNEQELTDLIAYMLSTGDPKKMKK